MYIDPGTDIYLFKNVPLDASYDDTVYFANESEQINWFLVDRASDFSPRHFINQTYQRLERGYCRLKVSADAIADYNYMAFRNTRYSSKWWFCFILGIEWVNNEVAELQISIDVIQTWLFEVSPMQSFISRCHSRTDVVGDNLLPETFELGDYISDGVYEPIIYDNNNNVVSLSEMSIVIMCNFDLFGDPIDGGMYGRVYSGLNYIAYDADAQGVQYVNNFLDAYSAKADDILGVYMIPKAFVLSKTTSPSTPNPLDMSVSKYSRNGSTDIYGFNFNNNKLLTDPYCFLYAITPNGMSAQYPYEYFSTASCDFKLRYSMGISPQCEIFPTDYKGVSVNWDEGLFMDGWPQCSWNVDSFKLYAANVAVPGIMQSFGKGVVSGTNRLLRAETAMDEIISSAQSAIVKNPRNAAKKMERAYEKADAAFDKINPMGAFSQPIASVVGGAIGAVYEHHVHPQQTRGVQQQNIFCSIGEMKYKFMHKHIRGEFAKIIDMYWDAYGYPCHRITTPDRTNRAKFTYIKTVGFNCGGAVSSDVKEAIKAVYDHGIRWWRKDVTHIGDTTTEARNRGNYPLGES